MPNREKRSLDGISTLWSQTGGSGGTASLLKLRKPFSLRDLWSFWQSSRANWDGGVCPKRIMLTVFRDWLQSAHAEVLVNSATRANLDFSEEMFPKGSLGMAALGPRRFCTFRGSLLLTDDWLSLSHLSGISSEIRDSRERTSERFRVEPVLSGTGGSKGWDCQ
jgi:hypothetical protein